MRHTRKFFFGAAAAGLVLSTAAEAAAAPRLHPALPASHHASGPSIANSGFGHWTAIGTGPKGSSVTGYGPAVWMDPSSPHEGVVIWLDDPSSGGQQYRFDTIGPTGSSSSSVLGKAWAGLAALPVLTGRGSTPLLVFSGSQGTTPGDPYNSPCIYGATMSSSGTWTLQSWSLSHQCTNPAASGVEYGNGTVAAAWQDLGTLKYRVGVSSTIPATGADNLVPLPSGSSAAIAGIAADEGSDANSDAGDTYVGWGQLSGTTAANGFFVRDVAAGGPTLKAPGSGANSISKVFGWVGMPMVGAPKGIFLAYPSAASTPRLLLWKVGATKALVVPGSSGAFAPQIAVGPQGRLWLSWVNSTYGIDVVRTNKADTKFGPVMSYPTPCTFLPSAALGSAGTGEWGRLDIGIKCQNKKNVQAIFVTQVLVRTSLSPSRPVIKNTQQNTVEFHVTDVGDPVAGAKVAVDGKTATTNVSGVASFTFPKGVKTGTYPVTVTDHPGDWYLPTHGSLIIDS
jgi:hypothetical protein